MFENGALRKIFGPVTKKVKGGWKNLHNEELHNLYASPNTIKVIKSRRMRLSGHAARAERVSTLQNTGKIPLGRSRSRRKGINRI
jgi:hypothetical protein